MNKNNNAFCKNQDCSCIVLKKEAWGEIEFIEKTFYLLQIRETLFDTWHEEKAIKLSLQKCLWPRISYSFLTHMLFYFLKYLLAEIELLHFYLTFSPFSLS